MASSSSDTRKYDVFLNFRGIDTRDGFTSYLYETLRLAEINTFIDKKLERGGEISAALLQEIESSNISVVIFSQNYAFSPYCLDELVKIIECKESIGQSVFPVFYKVDPTEIEELRGSYEKAFVEHEAKFKEEKPKLEKWKSALRKAVFLAGWHVIYEKDAAECITEIVSTISKKLNEEKKEALKSKLQELQATKADIDSRIKNAESFSSERQKIEVGNWLTNVGRIIHEAQSMLRVLKECRWTVQLGGRVERMIEDVRQLIDQKGIVEGALKIDAPQTNGKALLAKRLVGRKLQRNKDLILEWLSSDKVSNIGIYGMGGVGKTTLVSHIHNKLLENPSKFPHVYWVTVSQDFSVYKLQSLIAKTIQIDLEKEEDVRKRAATLSKELERRHKFVLILDDLWNHFVTEVGIPIDSIGGKLIVTTRSVEICRRTNSQWVKKVEPLEKTEAWDLFVETFGCNLSPTVEVIAKSITRECAGLPLAITIMAGSMRGVDDPHEWKNALTELKSSMIKQRDTGEEVFQILRYSYTRLNDSTLQQCLLYCALFPEDFSIPKAKLVEHLIVEGIIDQERDTREEKLNKGYTMLNKLEKVSLLERDDSVLAIADNGHVKMHDLIRDMAIQIMKECLPSIVEPGKRLQYVPDEKYWRKNIVRASLMKNEIEEIPSNFSPSCPNLSTLLLSENMELVSIAESFFNKLQGLKILDLSRTAIEELPESIGGLTNLSALFIRGSSYLSYIPTLANLQSMELLDLYGCKGIKKVPKGLELLSNLTYLDLRYSGIKKFPGGILPRLCHLQFLAFHEPSKNAEELGGLRRLEYLYWCFLTIADLSTYIQLLCKMPPNQIKYSICVGSGLISLDLVDKGDHKLMLEKCTVTRELSELHSLYFQVHMLYLRNVSLKNGRGLCLQNPIGLKSLSVQGCHGIEYLLNVSTLPSIFRSLETLTVHNMKNLKALFSVSEMMVQHPPNSTLSFCLKVLDIRFCSMKKLLPGGFLSHLQNLEKIEVKFCKELEEIISVEENSHFLPLSLPNLRHLILEELPTLNSICSKQIKCVYLERIFIYACKELKNVSISLPLPHLQSIKVSPLYWSEAAEWAEQAQKIYTCI